MVYKVDRLSRSLIDFARIMETFEKSKVSFVSVTQQFNTTTFAGRLTLNILLSFAQFEREIIAERTRDKMSAPRRKGKWTGGHPVLGYDIDPRGSRLVLNAAEAHQVRAIFNLYLDYNALLPVVNEIDRRGWRTKQWRYKEVEPRRQLHSPKAASTALLTNPIYTGKIKHKTDLYDGEHEPIVTPEIFRQVQAHLQHNGRTGGIEVRNKHGALLKGILVCKACDRAMTHTFTGKGSKRYRYYTCTQVIKKGRRSCPSQSLPAAEIEDAVVDQIRCIATDAGLREEVLRQAQAEVDVELTLLRSDLSAVERELARHHAEIRRLAVSGEQTTAATSLMANLQDRIAQSEPRLVELKTQIDSLAAQRLDQRAVDAAFADFDNVWKVLSPREQAQVLALLVARVEFDAADSTISVGFHPSAIKALADGQLGEAA